MSQLIGVGFRAQGNHSGSRAGMVGLTSDKITEAVSATEGRSCTSLNERPYLYLVISSTVQGIFLEI